jgi:hypothetical protein
VETQRRAVFAIVARVHLLCNEPPSRDEDARDLAHVENWRQALTDPTQTKAICGLPALAVSPDGRYVYVMHSKALRADAYAPGGSRYWVSVHLARSGNSVTDVEVPGCGGPGRLHTASSGELYVLCHETVRVIKPESWDTRRLPLGGLGPVTVRGSVLYSVTPDLRVTAVDMQSGNLIEDSTWNASGARIVGHLGPLALSADGLRLWVLTRLRGDPAEWGPDHLTEINLSARRRTDTEVRDIRGVGVFKRNVVYATPDRLRSLDGTIDAPLLRGQVIFWIFLSPP